jgi:hypothetical protein
MGGIDDVYIGTRIPETLNARLEVAARRENNRVSAVVRRLLTRRTKTVRRETRSVAKFA